MTNSQQSGDWRRGGPGKTPIDRTGVWQPQVLKSKHVCQDTLIVRSTDPESNPEWTVCGVSASPLRRWNEDAEYSWRRIGDLPEPAGKVEPREDGSYDKPCFEGRWWAKNGERQYGYVFKNGPNGLQKDGFDGTAEDCSTAQDRWFPSPEKVPGLDVPLSKPEPAAPVVSAAGKKGDREHDLRWLNREYHKWLASAGFRPTVEGDQFDEQQAQFFESPAGRAAVLEFLGETEPERRGCCDDANRLRSLVLSLRQDASETHELLEGDSMSPGYRLPVRVRCLRESRDRLQSELDAAMKENERLKDDRDSAKKQEGHWIEVAAELRDRREAAEKHRDELDAELMKTERDRDALKTENTLLKELEKENAILRDANKSLGEVIDNCHTRLNEMGAPTGDLLYRIDRFAADRLLSQQGGGGEKEPPVGLTPRWVHTEHRLEDVHDAIMRFVRSKKTVPQLWIDEYAELSAGVDRHAREA